MAHYPPWPPAAASPSAHPSGYPPPPPLPSTAGQAMALPPELQALNITPQQMAALLTHLQAGTFPLPPPPPPPPPPQAYQSAAPFAPVPFPLPVPTQTTVGQTVLAPTAVPSYMDIDREEGEVSDASQHINRAPSAPSSKKRKSRTSQLAHRTTTQSSPSSTPTKNNSDVSHGSIQQKREAVLPFIAALHQEGFTFDEFVREGFEENLLRQVYQDLQIPTVSPLVSSAQPPVTEAVAAKVTDAATTPPSIVPPVKEAKPTVPVKQAPPMNRQDYLARLQAAKNKKAEAVPTKQPVVSAKSATPPAVKNEVAPPPVVIPAESQPKPQEAQKTGTQSVAATNKQSQTTELIRKKMEALKATQRRLANNTNTSTSSTPGSTSTIHAVGQPQSEATPTPPTSRTPLASSQLAAPSLIPGLRMSTSMASSPQPQPQFQTGPTASSASPGSSKDPTPQPATTTSVPMIRKRPVASDLNEAQVVADHHPFKRPFGQSRKNSFDAGMIIQVSDDEDMSDDDDDELSSAKPLVKTSAVPAGQRDKNIRDLPPLRDFPQRSTAFQKQAGVFTPPLGTPGASSDAEELRRKELEITSLNQRIQEYEKRKAALKAKAKLAQSQPHTPSQIVRPSEKDSALPAPSPATSHAPTPATSQLKESVDRRTELKAALTARNADIDNQKARILEMQKQMADMQRQYDQDMENQRKLREELENLDVNTEGMTQAEMEAKKQEIENLQEPDPVGDSALPTTGSTQTGNSDVSMSESGSDSSPDDQSVADVQSPRTHRDATTSSPGRARVLDDIRADRAKADQIRTQTSEDSSDSDSGSSMSESSESEEDEGEDEHLQTNNMVTDASASVESGSENMKGVSESASAEPELADSQDKLVWLFIRNIPFTATKDLMHSFFDGLDVKRTHLPRHPTRDQGTGSGFVELPLSQAVAAIDQLSGCEMQNRKVSIQMSKFEPKLPSSLSPAPSSVSSDSSSDDEMDISTDSDEESEDDLNDVAAASRADVHTGTSVDEASAAEASADEDEDKSEDEDGDRMDLESSDASSEEYSPEPAAVPVSSLPLSQPSNTSRPNLADDLAPELQPTAEQQIGVTEANFKGYRYHPDYPREVQGGYRSLTYSHQIDPNKELCRYEVASGVCNDSSCDYQHFRDMGVSDDTVLLQMGMNGNTGKNAEYRQGLRDILQQMRDNGSLETEAVATRVAQYRRDFLKDPSNILDLN
ncbi:hypothetical protein E4T50_08272 [Aureobasidium sp. EXF-12298]|nr:hypothetical protein E4T50_08272 [Aureobasidium sp. EXF-12298]KAI4776162.1 hypothetical protein E4T52_08897 [Aureobasidium sp. EXF-3400]